MVARVPRYYRELIAEANARRGEWTSTAVENLPSDVRLIAELAEALEWVRGVALTRVQTAKDLTVDLIEARRIAEELRDELYAFPENRRLPWESPSEGGK